MKKECVFRIEVEGYLWRVVADPFVMSDKPRTYRIMHRRKCYAKLKGFNAQLAIEQCMVFALGCSVDIHWGVVL